MNSLDYATAREPRKLNWWPTVIALVICAGILAVFIWWWTFYPYWEPTA
jgi:hypothetical protein